MRAKVYNNGHYGNNIDLLITNQTEKVIHRFDIADCQEEKG